MNKKENVNLQVFYYIRGFKIIPDLVKDFDMRVIVYIKKGLANDLIGLGVFDKVDFLHY